MAPTWVDSDVSELGEYAVTSSYETYCFVGKFTASSSYTCNRLGIYSHADPVNDPYVKLAVFADSGGAPTGNLISGSETSPIQVNGGAQWFDGECSGFSVTNGNVYHVAHITSGAPSTQWRYRNATPANGGSHYNASITYPTFPSAPTAGPSSRRYGAYRMGYEAASGAISGSCSISVTCTGTISPSSISGSASIAMSLKGSLNLDWLSDWKHRYRAYIPSSRVKWTGTHFIALMYIGVESGINYTDMTEVFDEIGTNYKKIAITLSDGTTQIYGSIVKWDNTGEEGWILVSGSALSSTVDTALRLCLYCDSTKSDNTTYIGDPGDTVSQNLCESSLKLFHLLSNNPADTPPEYKDMTSGNHDGTENGTLTRVSSPHIGYNAESDATSGNFVSVTNHADINIETELTVVSMIERKGGLGTWNSIMGKMATGDRVLYFTFDTSNYIQLRLNTENAAGTFYVLGGDVVGVDGICHLLSATAKSGEGKMFIDGVQSGSTLTDTFTVLSTNTDNLHIGNNEEWGEEFTGEFGFMMIFDTVKPTAWHLQLNYAIKDNFIEWQPKEVYSSGDISGSTSIELTPSGTLNGIGNISGSISLSLTPTATASATGELSGSSDLVIKIGRAHV